ncbi:MAG: hypothetical protein U5K71_14795 [Gracilimonas sp.]|nr:hypothetical protein [Gracilimonas sp.]
MNLLPKIFFDDNREVSNHDDINAIQQHILWWLSYCRKIKFPSYQTSLDSEKSDFFEVLIYLFAKYTRRAARAFHLPAVSRKSGSEVQFVRGRLDMIRYINQNLSKGSWHKVNCIYDPFVLDNRFNQIIKVRYQSTLIIKQKMMNRKSI